VYCSAIDPTLNRLDFESAVPLTGKAGMVSFHHARVVHGSALNRSSRPRRLLIYQYAANDAWPLMGIKSLEAYCATVVRGTPVLEPRMTAVPVRIPLPVAPDYDGLYTSQAHAKSKYFETYEDARRNSATGQPG
jgi:ectoine hydroxylase-related dioxygenase (phytanoyl-CoA dioxygenase family)